MTRRLFFIGLFIILFQTTVLYQSLSFYGVYPSLITVFLILLSLKLELKPAVFLAISLGLVQDLFMNTLFFYSVIPNVVIVLSVYFVRSVLDFENFMYGISLVFFMSSVDYLLKDFLIFSKTGIFYIAADFLIYSLVNATIYIFFRFLIRI